MQKLKDDVQALQKIIKQLKHENFQLREILDNVPGDIYWKDVRSTWLGVNANGLKSLKKKGLPCKPNDLIGKTDMELFGEKIAKTFWGTDQKVMQNKQEISQEEPIILPSGETIYQLSTKRPLYDEKGEVIGIIGNTIDISYLKKIEDDLIVAKNKAEAASRAKTEFLANMSHDIKTPLTGIVGMADLMKHDHDAREVDRKNAEVIYACGLQAVSLFDSCLALSKMEMQEWVTKTETFSLKKLLNDIHALMLPKALTQQLSLTLEYDDALPEAVEGHRESLYRVLLNLVGNALKFTEHGGVILRALSMNKMNDQHVNIAFQIQDTGIGIPEDKHQIIFEKLWRLTPSYEGKVEGSGMGLYIVDQYVKRMNGSIQVESRVNEGSTFTVTLPFKIASELLPTAALPKHQKASSPVLSDASFTEKKMREVEPSSSSLILLVEDNQLVQLVTKNLLADCGFEVDIASDGTEALQLFSAGKYKLVFMDIGLPDIDGYAVTRAMREKEALPGSTPIIALTGHGAIDVQQFCGDAGMQGVLSKPLTRDQAQKIWRRYIESQIIDIPGFIFLGSS